MDDLNTLANHPGRGLRIFRGLISDDAQSANDLVNVRIPSYDPSRSFGPCHWAPRVLNDGQGLWPNRNDQCIVALDENDEAEILNWWAEDPTDAHYRDVWRSQVRTEIVSGWSANFTTKTLILQMGALGNFTLPKKNSWVHLTAQAFIRCTDAAWHTVEGTLEIDPPNVGVGNSISVARSPQSHHNAAGGYVPLTVTAQFYLPQQTFKNINFYATPISGNWQVYRAPDYALITAIVIPDYGQDVT